eukprot:scaffold563_cov410-Prasinococcus_capsulatus_cf.AAC.11
MYLAAQASGALVRWPSASHSRTPSPGPRPRMLRAARPAGAAGAGGPLAASRGFDGARGHMPPPAG